MAWVNITELAGVVWDSADDNCASGTKTALTPSAGLFSLNTGVDEKPCYKLSSWGELGVGFLGETVRITAQTLSGVGGDYVNFHEGPCSGDTMTTKRFYSAGSTQTYAPGDIRVDLAAGIYPRFSGFFGTVTGTFLVEVLRDDDPPPEPGDFWTGFIGTKEIIP